MANIRAVIFVAFYTCISAVRAENIRDLRCTENSLITLNGLRDAEGLWNTSFTLAKWNATSNWTFLVQHTVIESAGKLRGNLRGYLADGEQDPGEGMRRIWECNSLESNEYGPEWSRDEDFRLVPLSKWSLTKKKNITNKVRFQQTDSSCVEFGQCVENLLELHKKQISSRGRILFNFHLVPGGEILEDLGWDRIYDNEIIMNFLTKKPDVYPSPQALAAFTHHLRLGVSLGKLSNDYVCLNPSQTSGAFDSEVRRWCYWSKMAFRSDLTVPLFNVDGEVEVISRRDWNARMPIREFDALDHKAEVVEILQTNSECTTYEECAVKVRALQGEQMKRNSDTFANFIFGADGRIYEGLGWNWSRKEKVVYFEFLVKSTSTVPWTQILTAFSLQLREGIRLGKISDKYTIKTPHANKGLYAKILKWGEWSRNIVKENVTVSFQTVDGENSIVSRIDVGASVPEREIIPTEHPVDILQYTQSSATCNEPRNCVPYSRTLNGKTIKSTREVYSNFYFTDVGVVHEGLGWDRSTTENRITFEFLTASSSTLPSNQSMAASAFLVRDGVRSGKLSANFQVMVGKHTSIEFENEVRKWDSWVRDVREKI